MEYLCDIRLEDTQTPQQKEKERVRDFWNKVHAGEAYLFPGVDMGLHTLGGDTTMLVEPKTYRLVPADSSAELVPDVKHLELVPYQ